MDLAYTARLTADPTRGSMTDGPIWRILVIERHRDDRRGSTDV